MIFILDANCHRCGQPLNVFAGAREMPSTRNLGTGDLYLHLMRDGTMTAEALCKNIQVCDEYLARNPR